MFGPVLPSLSAGHDSARSVHHQYSSSVSPFQANTGTPAAAIAAAGIPVFAVKGESLKDYWDYTAKLFEWHGGGTPNMILDDGGDATMLVHHGLRAENGDTAFLDKPESEEEEVFYALIKKLLKDKPKGWFAEIAKNTSSSSEAGLSRNLTSPCSARRP